MKFSWKNVISNKSKQAADSDDEWKWENVSKETKKPKTNQNRTKIAKKVY